MNGRKRLPFCPVLFSAFPLLSQTKSNSAALQSRRHPCEDTHNSLLFFVRWYIVRKFTLKIPKSNTRSPSKFVLCFLFLPPQILSVASKTPVASLIIVIFPKIYSLAVSFFGPCAQTVTVFLSGRLSGQRIVPGAAVEDGAR